MLELLTQDKDFFPPALAAKLRAVRGADFDGFESDGKWLLHEFEQVRRAVRDTGACPCPRPAAATGAELAISTTPSASRPSTT